MCSPATITEVRHKVLKLKGVPPMPVTAQKILSIIDNADISELAGVIEQDPCLAARLIGLANSAYFGWPGGVHTISDAIY